MRAYRVALLAGLVLCLTACGTVLDAQADRIACQPMDWCAFSSTRLPGHR